MLKNINKSDITVYTLNFVIFQCMIWSWYLANDTQFYTLGILLLLLSSK
jgi:hypothetical protein